MRVSSDRVWITVGNPLDREEQEVERLTVDVPTGVLDFLDRLASYRNTLAELQGKKLKRRWSRKSMAESFLSAQCDAMRQQLHDMIKACGVIPEADDREAMERYVKKVIAWDKRHKD
jgi:hypothetical protein